MCLISKSKNLIVKNCRRLKDPCDPCALIPQAILTHEFLYIIRHTDLTDLTDLPMLRMAHGCPFRFIIWIL